VVPGATPFDARAPLAGPQRLLRAVLEVRRFRRIAGRLRGARRAGDAARVDDERPLAEAGHRELALRVRLRLPVAAAQHVEGLHADHLRQVELDLDLDPLGGLPVGPRHATRDRVPARDRELDTALRAAVLQVDRLPVALEVALEVGRQDDLAGRHGREVERPGRVGGRLAHLAVVEAEPLSEARGDHLGAGQRRAVRVAHEAADRAAAQEVEPDRVLPPGRELLEPLRSRREALGLGLEDRFDLRRDGAELELPRGELGAAPQPLRVGQVAAEAVDRGAQRDLQAVEVGERDGRVGRQPHRPRDPRAALRIERERRRCRREVDRLGRVEVLVAAADGDVGDLRVGREGDAERAERVDRPPREQDARGLLGAQQAVEPVRVDGLGRGEHLDRPLVRAARGRAHDAFDPHRTVRVPGLEAAAGAVLRGHREALRFVRRRRGRLEPGEPGVCGPLRRAAGRRRGRRARFGARRGLARERPDEDEDESEGEYEGEQAEPLHGSNLRAASILRIPAIRARRVPGLRGRSRAIRLRAAAISLQSSPAGTVPARMDPEKQTRARASVATTSGIEIEPVYEAPGRATGLGAPGEYPFTRGAYATMYRGQLWTMRQYAGFSSARETNRRFRSLLESGQTGLSVAFDLPTQIGYDSDHPLAKDEAGLVGVPVNSLRDVERLFDGIPLREASTSMTINATACVLLALYAALARKQGVPLAELRGTVQNDILKEYAARGNYRFPAGPSMRLATDLIAWCAREVPRWNTISISGYHIREAGSSAVQELAFTLSNGIAYVRAAVAAGLAVDEFGPRISFFFNAHNHLFEEVAKFRAARRMWARIMKEEFGARDARSLALRFHAQTAGSMLTSQQPETNVVRVTVQALAAVLGGTQSLTRTRSTRRSGCRRSARRAWRCARSRSSRTSRA
jgi:hypothetical protein